MDITSNVKGQIAMTKVELRALELGYIPSRPAFDTRYDVVLDLGNELKRIQVKYADGKPSSSDGAVVVKLEYVTRKGLVKSYLSSEIDGLIVYIPKIDGLCFIPPKLFVGKRKIQIRLRDSKNNQKTGIILARDYIW